MDNLSSDLSCSILTPLMALYAVPVIFGYFLGSERSVSQLTLLVPVGKFAWGKFPFF